MAPLLFTWLTGILISCTNAELVQNGGFESLAHWDCWNYQCTITNDSHTGQHGVEARNRHNDYEGPSQYIPVVQGHSYAVRGWIKLLNDEGQGQPVRLEVDFKFSDNSHYYIAAAELSSIRASEGWVELVGSFTAPSRPLNTTRIYYQGPAPAVNFIVDDASVVEQTGNQTWREITDDVINNYRKSDIHVQVASAAGVNQAEVQIQVIQTRKSFPFGSAVSAPRYNDPNLGKYRDFIHQHFNWAVPDNALKWPAVEPQRGQKNYQPALDLINGLRNHGIKVRGHCLVWSVEQFIQDWVKQLSGNELRTAVQEHIEETMQMTRGLLEHWDVNNENLHGHWYQDRLNDSSYNLELFRIAHTDDPNVKLFLNDYSVVASGSSTGDYLHQAQQFKAADVGLYGMGTQCHFGDEQEPDPNQIKLRLDTLAEAGLPIWVTELDVLAQDENKRADFYEKALRALYGHPAVEGILFWGFWDGAHWRGPNAALAQGSNLDLTAAGRRVLDLFENQWMTEVTHPLSQGSQFTVRGFHGDYEVRVIYQGRELSPLRKTFSLGKSASSVSVDVFI